jgi:hypothetical protein
MKIFITRILLGLAHLLSEFAFKLMPRARVFVNSHNVVETLERKTKPTVNGLRSKVKIKNRIHVLSRVQIHQPIKRPIWG